MNKFFKSLKAKVVLLSVFCVGVLVWNMALSSRRKNLNGSIIKVKKENVALKINCPGKIEPKIQETIRAEVDGAKKAVFVHEGDPVVMGQLLMEIDDDRISIELNQKRTTLKNSTEDFLKAKKDYELAKSLFRQLAVPRQDVDNAKQAFERSSQSLKNAKDELMLTEKKAKGVKVYSPMSGVVLKIFIENEPSISIGKELIKVAKPDQFMIKGRVDELDIAQVKEGQPTSIRCDAFKQTEIQGVVGRIGAQANDGAFAEIEVMIDVTDFKGLSLKPNLSCESSIMIGEMKDAVVLPASAIRQGASGPYILEVKAGGFLSEKPVKIARISGGQAYIQEGLSSGQMVLVPQDE